MKTKQTPGLSPSDSPTVAQLKSGAKFKFLDSAYIYNFEIQQFTTGAKPIFVNWLYRDSILFSGSVSFSDKAFTVSFVIFLNVHFETVKFTNITFV